MEMRMRVIPMGLGSLVHSDVAEEVQAMVVSMQRITYIAEILMKIERIGIKIIGNLSTFTQPIMSGCV